MKKQVFVFCSGAVLALSSVVAQAQTQWISPSASIGSTNQQFMIGTTPSTASGVAVRKLTLQGDTPWLVIKDTLGDANGDIQSLGLKLKGGTIAYNILASSYTSPTGTSNNPGQVGPSFAIVGVNPGGTPVNRTGFFINGLNSFRIGSSSSTTPDGTLNLNLVTTNVNGALNAKKGFQSLSTTVNNYFAASVTIGTSTMPAGYMLGVNGKIIANSIKVQAYAYWSDYVFNKDYKLKPLEEVEAYIAKENHLPDVPSAAEVVKDGIDPAQMLEIQMRKIEELTLYVIELQKEVNALKK